MGPFSVTGQPNAMGGREVGGLANQLAAHLDIEDADDRAFLRAFWNAPRMAERPGLKAVDMFEAVRDGRIKALWIMATNPAATLPDASRVREALANCPFVVVSDVDSRHRHAALRAREAARRRLGREGRHGDELGAPHLAPARLPAAPRRRRGPIGGS